MEWFIAAVAVAALGVAAMAAAGGVGEMSNEPVYDVYRQDLPESPLTAEDLERVRFGVALRGYAMGQVDDLLERLGREIADRDTRIAALTADHADLADGDREGMAGVTDAPTSERLSVAPRPDPDGSHRVGQP